MTMIHIAGPSTKSEIDFVHGPSVQPNAYDLRLNRVFRIEESSMTLNETSKVHKKTTELEFTQDTTWFLPEGVYDCLSIESVSVAEGEAGFVITRSTLNRNGITAHSGLYDSGFSGQIGFMLRVSPGGLYVDRGTRVAQFVMFEAESVSQYDGSYGSGRDFDRYA